MIYESLYEDEHIITVKTDCESSDHNECFYEKRKYSTLKLSLKLQEVSCQLFHIMLRYNFLLIHLK